MDPNFLSGLHALLQQTTSNDTATLQAATAKLNLEYYKNPQCISALTSILTSSPEQPVRQLAAVELRKRAIYNSGNLWTMLPQDEREQIKQNLPTCILAESNKLVRHSAARALAAIASIELPLGTWNQLLPLLHQACISAEVGHREVGSYIMFAVLESIVEGFQEHLPSLMKLFEQNLVDPESLEVRVTTVKSLKTLAQYIDSDEKPSIRAYQALVPSMIQVIGQTIEAQDESSARALFDAFEALLILEVPVLSRHIPDLVQSLLQWATNRNVDADFRVLALNALNWTIEYKRSKVQSGNLAPVILQAIMSITSEEEPEDGDDDAPSRSALRVIDTLSTNLPPSQVFPSLRSLLLQYFSSSDPAQRRGAMMALGISVEGCSEYMTPLMAEVWPIIEAGLQDGDAGVRKATCVAVSCFCEWLEDECAAKHAVLMPAIMNLIADPATQKAACTALDALLEILHDVIDQYLALIMERLGHLLDTASVQVKGVVTGAIGSAAHAAKEKFVPYFLATMNRLQHFLVLTGEGEETELRGITMDAIGTFAESVGKDMFRPFFPDMMKQAFEGIQLGSARLRECSFLFFGVMARVFGEEFAPYLPNVVPHLLQSCKQNEHADDFNISEASSAFDSGSSPANAIAVNEVEIDLSLVQDNLEDIDLDKLLDVNSSIAVEKEIAADTIGTLFAATQSHFLPYVEQCTLELVTLLEHYYEGIRKSALDSLLEMVRTFYDLSEPAEWVAGATVHVPLNTTVKELVNHVMPPILSLYETEDNKSVASGLCVGLAETINKLGPAFIEGYLEQISSITIELLEQRATCQQDPDQDEAEETPEDQAEYASVLISAAEDLVAALASALGPDFVQPFNTFLPLITKFYTPSRSLSERSSAIGCLAEIITGMTAGVTPKTEELFELFYRALSDPDYEVQSNAAFGLGLLVEHSHQHLGPQYLALLQGLQPLFNVNGESPTPALNAKDNAAGAVARMILRDASALPLDRVLPIFIGALPLKNDYLENRPVFKAIIGLLGTQPEGLYPFMDHLLQVFVHVLDPNGPDQLGDIIRAELTSLITRLNSQDAAKIQAAGLSVYVQTA